MAVGFVRHLRRHVRVANCARQNNAIPHDHNLSFEKMHSYPNANAHHAYGLFRDLLVPDASASEYVSQLPHSAGESTILLQIVLVPMNVLHRRTASDKTTASVGKNEQAQIRAS